MIRLVHHVLHVPVAVDAALERASRPMTTWPGVAVTDGATGGSATGTSASDDLDGADVVQPQELVLPVTPAGLTAVPGDQVVITLRPGPAVLSPDGVLRRLSMDVQGVTPTVRGDLTIRPAVGHGVRVRFRGEFRSTGDRDAQLREVDAVESIVQPLVRLVADMLMADTPVADLATGAGRAAGIR